MKFFVNKDKYIFTEKFLIIILIVFAIIGCLGPLVLKQFNLALLGIYIGIPMLSGPLIWLVLRPKEINSISISNKLYELLILLYIMCYFFSILILHYFPVRTLSYYILVAFMGAIILTQILLENNLRSRQIIMTLIQIILLFLNIIWGVTLKYYFFVGRTDVFFHSWAIENLLKAGYINQAFDMYEAFPLWHILCAFIDQIMNLSIIPAKVMFITNGLIYGCLVIVIYLAATEIFNTKIALLSALVMCFNTDSIFYGMYSISRSVVFFLEGLLILLLLQEKTKINIILRFLLVIGLIMYHTASMPFIILILALFYIVEKVYPVSHTKQFVNFNFLLLMFVLTVTYWMYAGVKVFNSIAGSLLKEADSGILTQSIVKTPVNELFNYLQYSPLLIFIILGVLWGLRTSQLKGVAKIFLIISLLLVPVTFPGPALLINKLAGNFNLGRFGEYSFIFISIAGATGLYILFYKLKKKYKALVIICFFVMAFLTVSNDFTASDHPLVKRPFYTFYLTEEENIALKSMSQITEGYLMSDYITCRYLESSASANKVHILEVDPQKQEFLKRSGKDTIFVRKGELAKRPLKLFTAPNGQFIFNPSLGDSLVYYDNNLPIWKTVKRYNAVYDSGAVMAFQNPDSGGE